MLYTHIVHYLFKILSRCSKDSLIKRISLNQPVAPFKWNFLIYFFLFSYSIFMFNSDYGSNSYLIFTWNIRKLLFFGRQIRRS